jgi:hypothetical protein
VGADIEHGKKSQISRDGPTREVQTWSEEETTNQ